MKTRHLALAGLITCILHVSSPALAEPTLADKATAQALFEDGLQLMGAKRYAEACPKLEESERLDPALGTRFRLSECEEAVGRLASAWAGFLEVADLAHTAGQADRETVARQRAAAIAPRLSKLNVVVAQPETAGLEVTHDHVIIGRGQWGTPVPIDAGTYTITATATDKKPWRGSVTIAGDGTTGTLTIPPLENAPVTAVPPPVVLAVSPAPREPAAEAHHANGTKILGFALVGAGAAGMAMSGVLGLVAKSNYNGAGCGATTCSSQASESSLNSARSLANAATVVFVVGTVAAAAGVVVVLLAPRSTDTPASKAALHLGVGSLLLEGTF